MWRTGERHKPERLLAFEKSWAYAEETCAADGMCQVLLDPKEARWTCLLLSVTGRDCVASQEKCPVKINTGELIKTLRQEALEATQEGQPTPRAAAFAGWLASPSVFGAVSRAVRLPMADTTLAYG